MLRKSRPVNRFAAAADAANKGRAVYADNGKNYNLQRDYPHRLNFYLKPPPQEITIEEFEGFALDRLQVLRAIDTASLRNKDVKLEIQKTVEEYLPLKSNASKSENLYEERRKDHVSHYVLRMAYCKNDDLRAWFIKQECALFRYRFDQESPEDKKSFLAHLNLNWRMLTAEEKENMREELEICSRPRQGISVQDYIANETFFEVDYIKVPQMVATRSVYIKKGKAYVPMAAQVNIVMLEYKQYLERALDAISKLLPRLEEDDRLRPILHNVEKQYVGKNYDGLTGSATGTVSAQDVDLFVTRHAPLCMRTLNESLKHDKHLKHFGRLQYGLFLKGIGLSVQDALIFWRTAFSSITDDKFNKEYGYNVRYNYGLEGSRKNYSPYSCVKIITSNAPSSGDHHGCPFRHYSPANLETKLLRDNVKPADVDQIIVLVNNKHYQLACTRHFEVTHPQNKEKIEAIEHPNQYYELSKKLEEENEASKQKSTEALQDDMEIDD